MSEQVQINGTQVTVNAENVTVTANPADLKFWQPVSSSPDLVFGLSETPTEQHVHATLDGTLPALTFSGLAVPNVHATLDATFPALTLVAEATYESKTQRPVVGAVLTDWQEGTFASAETIAAHQDGNALPSDIRALHTEAVALSASVAAEHTDADPIIVVRDSRFENAQRVAAAQHSAPHQDADPIKLSRSSTYDNAQKLQGRWVGTEFEDGIRVHTPPLRSRYQTAHRLVPVSKTDSARSGVPLDAWLIAPMQEAMRPPVGLYVKPVVPIPPEKGWSTDLLFAKLYDGSTDLLFGWQEGGGGATVVVPVREVYMVLNEVSIRRVSNSVYLPPLSFSLKLDMGSWTWGFSANFPTASLSDLEPNSQGDPVELEVMVNGQAYRVLVESISRERAFPSGSINVSGRGKSAYLDAPYAATRTFNNTQDRTAQQLMNDALTINGVSIGWDVDWQITDWLVPAGAWAHNGTYISALKTIASAAGAYLQPHPTSQIVRVKPTYAEAPWNWNSLTPDFELPVALTTREGIAWTEKARYDSVYVTGVSNGVVSQVKRTGTAGNLNAPMVVDPLITHADAARQRGIAVLGDTGRIAEVSLRIPVLPETGIIEPGAIIDYVDGGITRRGVVRSVDVSVAYPDVFQQLGVETHA